MSTGRTQTGYYTGGKAFYVREMFASIALRYDLLNTILSFNRHRVWRQRAVRLANLNPGDSALDVCTGTGDFALDLYRVAGAGGLVVGSDFCAPMVELGKVKTDPASHGRIGMMLGDAMRLPYRSSSFDSVTVGFGMRNVADVQEGFNEMARVAKPGGRVVCLEFNRSQSRFWRPFCDFYERCILPRIGGLFSRREAYAYLQASIRSFYSREDLVRMMEKAGLTDVRVINLNLGSVCIHVGIKQ